MVRDVQIIVKKLVAHQVRWFRWEDFPYIQFTKTFIIHKYLTLVMRNGHQIPVQHTARQKSRGHAIWNVHRSNHTLHCQLVFSLQNMLISSHHSEHELLTDGYNMGWYIAGFIHWIPKRAGRELFLEIAWWVVSPGLGCSENFALRSNSNLRCCCSCFLWLFL